MADVANDIRDAIGEVFDTLRDDVFFDKTDTLTLLKASASSDEFEDIIEISKWFAVEGKNATSVAFEIPMSFEDLTDAMADATHVRIDTGHATQVRSTIYRINDGGVEPPVGTRLMWVLPCTQFETQDGYSILR